MAEEQEKQEQQAEEQVEEKVEEKQEQKDRTTEQFDKLKESNKELKDERDKYKNLLDSLRPEKVPEQIKYPQPINKAPQAKEFGSLKQDDIDTVFESMKDPEGYLDGNKLLTVLKQMDTRARAAEQKAEKAVEHSKRVMEAAEERSRSDVMTRVHEKYPMLDPESKSTEFDKDFYEAVRNDLIGQMMEGKEDPMAAADKWYNKLYSTKVTKEEKEQKEQKEEAKKQINAAKPGATTIKGYYEADEEEELRKKVQEGKKGALAEMLRRRGQ